MNCVNHRRKAGLACAAGDPAHAATTISPLTIQLMATASALVLAAAVLAQPAFGQSAAPGSAVILDTIIVEEGPDASGEADLSVKGVGAQQQSPEEIARTRLEALAGGTAIITEQEMFGRADVTVADSLAIVPGVVVQSFFGGNDQPRIQIRGSGLQQSPVERGILMLRDGMPLNRADGSYIVGFADPRQAQFTEVYRGYTANRLGATVLGGAINFISPTGTSAPGAFIGIEGGSFGQITTTAGAGARQDNFDGYAQVSYTNRDGFRDYNKSDRVDANVNFGARLSEIVSTRFFAGYTDLGFQIPGPLPWNSLQQDPKQIYPGPIVTLPGPVISNPGPDVVRDKPRRDAEQFRVASRTSATIDEHLLDFEIGYTYTDDTFRFPIGNGIRATDGGDLTGVVRYSYGPDSSQPLPLFEATAMYAIGSASRDYHQNVAGTQGLAFGDNELDATTLTFYAGMNIPLADKLTLSPAVSYSYATRDNDDNFGMGFRPVAGFNPVTGAYQAGFALPQNTSYSRDYADWSPSLGLTFEVDPDNTIFGAVSRSFEPPTHDDLLATINGNPFFSPGAPKSGVPQFAFATPNLDAQTATTIEAGWRGHNELLSWDGVVYYSWIDNELLSLRDASGTRLPSQNADKTSHFGIELGLSAQFTEALGARIAYTFQEFQFDNDPVFRNNRLAGAPQHILNAALRYSFTPEFFVEAEVNWWPGRTPVDNANTLFNQPWVTADIRAAYEINEHFSIFGEVRNVLDEVYASSVLITDTAQPGQAAFLPGDGRAFIVGLKARM